METLGSVLNTYLSSDRFNKLSENTKRAYAYAAKHLTPFLGMDMSDVRRSKMLAIADSIKNPGSRRMALVLIKNAAQLAYDYDHIDKMPDTKIKNEKQTSHLRWTMEEFNTFVENAPQHVADLAYFALYTGQRKSDLIRMKWSDFDGEAILFRQKKTGAEVKIPLAPILLGILRRIDRFQGAARNSGGCILTNRNGEFWTEDNARRSVERVRKKFLLRPVNLHGLRRTAASILAEKGLSASQIQSVLGHKSLGEVSRYTAAASQYEMAKLAIERLTED